MAFASLLTLLDDITSVLDDVALMTKMAAQKTTGVVGDDLALNAQQVTGVSADRELPVVWAVAKGSLVNKAILVPLALLIAYFLPQLITPLLMVGGAYLCFEGVEKLGHKLTHRHHQTEAQPVIAKINPTDEKSKIRGAIRTDFVLSAEIIIVALGVAAPLAILPKSLVLAIIGVGMTLLVYGAVACIVKLDDIGAWLSRRTSGMARASGQAMILVVPWLMRLLTIAGTLAMFLVGGGIMAHGLGALHRFLAAHHGDSGILNLLVTLVIGVITGTAVWLVVWSLSALKAKIHAGVA